MRRSQPRERGNRDAARSLLGDRDPAGKRCLARRHTPELEVHSRGREVERIGGELRGAQQRTEALELEQSVTRRQQLERGADRLVLRERRAAGERIARGPTRAAADEREALGL